MSGTMNKLQALLKTKAAIEADLKAEQQAIARIEQERLHAEREKAAAIQQAEMDARRYNSANEMIDKILAAMGKGIKEPRAPFVAIYLMLTSRDAIGQATPQAGVNALTSYWRAANSLTKKEG